MKSVGLFILFLLLASSVSSYAQLRDSANPNVFFVAKKIVDGDTLPHVNLPEVIVVTPWVVESKSEMYRYSRLVVNIKKTLPYARLANHKINQIADSLHTFKVEKERKLYLKESERELFAQFEQPLKKMTYSQGRLLIKLIDRETGNTSYDLIKDLKGGFSAFMWQSVARIFGSNLKDEYNGTGNDAMIEHIIIMIDNGML